MKPVLWRKTYRDLWQRKGSLAALALIMTVGVGCYVGMALVYRDLETARARYYARCRLADFEVSLKRAPIWTIEEVARLPNVAAVRGRVLTAVRIDLPGARYPITGTALSLPARPAPIINDVLLRSGGWFSGDDSREVILNDAFAEANGILPGDRVRVLLPDKEHDLLVVGTAMSPEFVYLIPSGGGIAPDPERFGVLYMPEQTLRESSDLEGAYNQLVGIAHDPSRGALDRTLTMIEDRLDAYGVTNTTPIHEQASARFLADELTGLRISARVLPPIFLGVAALVLNIIIGRLVAQQRTIIGTLRALGYSAGDLTRHYLAFGCAVGLAGGLTGLVLGYYFEGLFLDIYRQYFALPNIRRHFNPPVLLVGLGISLLFAVLGIVKGVRQSARLEPAEAMRPPPPEKGGKVLPERLPVLWRRLSFRWKIILRAVFRNPFRSTVCILASTISTSLIVAALSLVDSLDYLMHYEFERISHQDETLSLRDPVGMDLRGEVSDMPTVGETEHELSVVCDISTGLRSKRIGVTGIGPGNRLHTPLDAAGTPVEMPDEGLVLTDKLADILGVGPGDAVRLRPLIARRTEVTAVVTGVVRTYLGLSAYADIGYLSRLLGEDWAANIVLSRLQRRLDGPDDADGVSPTVEARASDAFLNDVRRRPVVVGVGERTRQLERMDQTFGETQGISITVMVFFAALIAFGSVLNAALVSLSERRREVGTFRVLGFTNRAVAGIFAGESYLLNGLGIVLGVFGGIGLAHALSRAYDTELYRFPAIVRIERLVLSVVLMALFVAAAQWVVRRMIRRQNWLEVLNVRE